MRQGRKLIIERVSHGCGPLRCTDHAAPLTAGLARFKISLRAPDTTAWAAGGLASCPAPKPN
jgi:hypothetical protein